MTPNLAHVRWYTDGPAEVVWEFVADPVTVTLLLVAVVIAVAWVVLGGRLPRPEITALHPLGRLAPWIPRLVAIHLGVSLLSLAVANEYLAPGLGLDDVPGGWAIAFGQGMVGVWLITGVALRPAAVGVVALGPLGLVLAGPLPVLEAVDLLGLAAFLLVLPPGRDAHGASGLDPATVHRAVLLLRVGLGVSLIVLAFSEKLLVPDLARELLGERPGLDPLQAIGLTGDPDLFIRVASAVELLLGLLILAGVAPQLLVLIAAVPFNLTLAFFDRFELIGHLPIYGALLAVLVYGSHPATADAVPTRSPRRRPPASETPDP